MRDLAFFGLFLAMLPAAFRFTNAAAMLWTWIALSAPNYYLFGFARGIPYNKIVVAVGLFSLVYDKKSARLFFVDTHMRLLTAFVLIGMISYTLTPSTTDLPGLWADRVLKEFALCVFLVAAVRDRLSLHSLMLAAGMGMGIHGAIEAAKFLVSAGHYRMIVSPSFGDNNSFGVAVLMVIPVLIYLFRYSATRLVRVAFGVGIVLNTLAIVATNSRGALVGLGGIAVAGILRSRYKIRLLALAGTVAIVLPLIAPASWYARMSTISTAENDNSFMGRVMSWKMHVIAALDRPLTGVGYNGLLDPDIFHKYLPQFDELSFIPTNTPTAALAAHSIYFEVLGDTGFIGFFLFIGILAIAFRNLRIVRRLTRDRPDLLWARDLAEMLRLSMIAFALGGAALSIAYYEIFYVLATSVSILRRHVASVVAQESQPAALRIMAGAGRPGLHPVPAPGRLARR